MTNSQEKRVNRTAQTKGYRLEKVGKARSLLYREFSPGFTDCLRHHWRRIFFLAPGS